MTVLTQKPGPDSSPEETLTELERFAVNEKCRQVFDAWEYANRPYDFTDLMVQLNAGVARAVKIAREVGKS